MPDSPIRGVALQRPSQTEIPKTLRTSQACCPYSSCHFNLSPISASPKPDPSEPHHCNMPQAKTEVALQFSECCAAGTALQHCLFCSAEVIWTKSCAAANEKLHCNIEKAALQESGAFLPLFGGSQKGGFQKGGFGGCSPGTKTGTRVRSPKPPFWKPPFYLPMTLFGVDKRVVSKRVVSADVPPERKPERGYVRQNHPNLRNRPFISQRTKTH